MCDTVLYKSRTVLSIRYQLSQANSLSNFKVFQSKAKKIPTKMFKLVRSDLYLIKMQTSDLKSVKCRYYWISMDYPSVFVLKCSWLVRYSVINVFSVLLIFFVQIVAVLFFFAVASAAPRPTYISSYPSVYSSGLYSPLATSYSSYSSYPSLYSSSIYSPYSAVYSPYSAYSAYSPLSYGGYGSPLGLI